MTVDEAIAVLHNNQYQKHIGNGEYEYIHPLTDSQCKGIEALLQQQQQQIEQLRCCGNCKFRDEKFDAYGEWVQTCKYDGVKNHVCVKQSSWEATK